LTEDHGDKLGRHVLRSEKKSCSRTPVRRSVNHGTDVDLLLFSTTMVTRKKKIRPSSA
jgi:hypothetical protein